MILLYRVFSIPVYQTKMHFVLKVELNVLGSVLPFQWNLIKFPAILLTSVSSLSVFNRSISKP